MDSPNLYICSGLVLLGILFHFVTKLGELEAQGTIVTPWAYWREHPYTSLVVVMSAYIALAMTYSIGEMSYYAAVVTGIACNSLGDKLRARSTAWSDRLAQGK